MRYSLLNVLCCQHCGDELTTITCGESPCDMGKVVLAPFARVPPAGAGVGPVPAWRGETETTRLLDQFARESGDPDRNYSVVLQRGLLVCGACERWYPVIDAIPELLPDHLRDWTRDVTWLDGLEPFVPAPLAAHLRTRRGSGGEVTGGERFKAAEIALPGRVDDPGFFGPGAVSPFNPSDPDHSWHLVESFAAARPLLGLQRCALVIDMGSGYSWTTEWLFKSGYEAIGVDICRAYLEIGLRRIGAFRPHLLVGDVENPPFKPGVADAVLGFEAFHHLPDRPRALAAFARLLKPGAPVVLVEPGAAHEHAQVSIDVMAKYGTLEKGMDLEDVQGYASGLPFHPVEQHWCIRVTGGGADVSTTDDAALRSRSITPNNVFTLRRIPDAVPSAVAVREVASPASGQVRRFVRRVVWPRVKRRAKAAAVRLGLE